MSTSERSWDEFREAGLLWWINRSLHLIGWTIVASVEPENGNTTQRVYPARTNLRGFSLEVEADGFLRLTRYLARESPELLIEVELEDDSPVPYRPISRSSALSWREVTDTEPPPGVTVLGWREGLVPVLIRRYTGSLGTDEYWRSDLGRYTPTHWCPLPPVPGSSR